MTILADIRTKVRRVTGTPSQFQLTDSDLDQYINTFYLYDMPEQLRILKLKDVFTFFTKPDQDEYEFPDEAFYTVEGPFFAAGYRMRYFQDREMFYRVWPPLDTFQQVGTGDGTAAPALQNLNFTPALKKSVYISASVGGNVVTFIDNGAGSFNSESFTITNISQAPNAVISAPGHPFVAGDTVRIQQVIGMLQINEITTQVLAVAPFATMTVNVNSSAFTAYSGAGIVTKLNAGSINYQTGAIAMNWGQNTDAGTNINAQWIGYTGSRPFDILYFHNKFTLRPVPDKAYKIDMNVFKQPTALLSGTARDFPELREWWQYIAYGAAAKVFADRLDINSLNQVTPLLEEQKLLIQRRTLKQLTNQRAQTIYTDQQPLPLANFYPFN